ncbi:hypothetical protein [Limosilactobacillus panis]|uniref:Uncharacterized protein n=1 Tax=Limosilactobacillus panis TaxID=47493 RepID=A0ABT7VLH6_9LACO|nr:hypothetical protein [Limosilactobacillus panis]MDM8333578.1 hypothetical protein [Limosilactobacillus panis]HJA21774.1 hypothetical protein [Candidatus Limosilactobacillus intestinipullorum]
MTKHQRRVHTHWLNIRYAGEDEDDGCANELSFYAQPTTNRLQLLLTNVDFQKQGHDNTFSLDRDDAQALAKFLTSWLKEN